MFASCLIEMSISITRNYTFTITIPQYLVCRMSQYNEVELIYLKPESNIQNRMSKEKKRDGLKKKKSTDTLRWLRHRQAC